LGLIAISVVVLATLTVTRPMVAAGAKDARVTQVIRDVRLFISKTSGRPAVVNDNVHEGTAVRTGGDSRAELTFADLTLTRLGANTLFSFGDRAREFDLGGGACLLCVPKTSGEVRINTPGVTAGVTGGIVMIETHSASWTKVIVIEGEACVKIKRSSQPCLKLLPGEMVVLPPHAKSITEKKLIDLRKLTVTSALINQAPLPGWADGLIAAEVRNQQTSPPAGGYIDPTALDKIDQKKGATKVPTPPQRPPSTPPPTPPPGGR
jgi:FecR protein